MTGYPSPTPKLQNVTQVTTDLEIKLGQPDGLPVTVMTLVNALRFVESRILHGVQGRTPNSQSRHPKSIQIHYPNIICSSTTPKLIK